MDNTYKKIDLYQYVFNEYLLILRNSRHTPESLASAVHRLIREIYRISNDEFCPLLTSSQQTRIISPKIKTGQGVNNSVGELSMLQNGKIRRVKSIQNTFSQSSFVPVNKDMIFRRGLDRKEFCLIIDYIEHLRAFQLQFKDPFGELIINSVLSVIFDLQVCFGICKTYGFYLCDHGRNSFSVSNIIEKSSFTVKELFDYFHREQINQSIFEMVLTDVILQLFFTLYALKEWIGFVHYDLHPGNIMISNYGDIILPHTKLASTKYGGKNINTSDYIVLYKDRNTTYVGDNEFKCVVKIIDYGYSSMFQNFCTNSPLHSNIIFSPIVSPTPLCTPMKANLGGGTGHQVINSIISSNGQNMEILMSDFYFGLCFILSYLYLNTNYNLGGLTRFPIIAGFLRNTFGLREEDINKFIIPEVRNHFSTKTQFFFNRNIVNSVYKRFPLVHNFFRRYRRSGIVDLSRDGRFSRTQRDTSSLFCINKSVTENSLNKYNPVAQKLKQFRECPDWDSCPSGMYLSVPPLLSSIKKYVVTLADYQRGFSRINRRYLLQDSDGYSIYKFIFLWEELGRIKSTKPQNRWFDGTFGADKNIYGTCVYMIPKKSNIKIDLVRKRLTDKVRDASERNSIFINGNYFIVDGNYRSLNPPAADLNGYPIGYYYKRNSRNQMGTALQFPPELLAHYGVVWKRKNTVNISSWEEFAAMHEKLNVNITYVALNSPTKKRVRCSVPVIKMRDAQGRDSVFGAGLTPVLKSGVEPYDFAFTCGPFLVKGDQPYFNDRILNQQITFNGHQSCDNSAGVRTGAKMSYYHQDNPDNLLFRMTEAGGGTIYGQKHSNWLTNSTVVGLSTQGELKFFIIEGRGFDYPGIDRVEAAKLLSRKFGMRTVVSLDGGFSSNAVFYSEAEHGWRRLVDIPEDRHIGLVIRLF